MRKIRILVCILFIFCLLYSLSSCKNTPQTREKTYFEYFDTVSTVYSFAGDSPEKFDENCREIEKILEKYHRLFDIYHEYEGINNLCTVNKQAGGEPLEVDGELVEFLLYAKGLYATTGGEMNVMMGSVLSLWHGFREAAEGQNGATELPRQDELAEAARHTSIDLLEIDREKGTVRITDPEAAIDVGALGKGYATEKAAKFLEDKGISSYVLDIGGNLRIVGEKPDGGGWITGIKDPHDSSRFVERLLLSDISCVTSGDYERFCELDGVRYHHIIDRDTLYPARHFSSVTVICRDSGLADALSTALFCMSYEEGRALVEKMGGVEVIWVTVTGDKLCTDGIAEMRAK